MRGDTHYNDIISRHMLLYSATLSSLLDSLFFFFNRRYVARCQPALANVFFPAKCSWDNARLVNTDGYLTVSHQFISYLVNKQKKIGEGSRYDWGGACARRRRPFDVAKFGGEVVNRSTANDVRTRDDTLNAHARTSHEARKGGASLSLCSTIIMLYSFL